MSRSLAVQPLPLVFVLCILVHSQHPPSTHLVSAMFCSLNADMALSGTAVISLSVCVHALSRLAHSIQWSILWFNAWTTYISLHVAGEFKTRPLHAYYSGVKGDVARRLSPETLVPACRITCWRFVLYIVCYSSL